MVLRIRRVVNGVNNSYGEAKGVKNSAQLKHWSDVALVWTGYQDQTTIFLSLFSHISLISLVMDFYFLFLVIVEFLEIRGVNSFMGFAETEFVKST